MIDATPNVYSVAQLNNYVKTIIDYDVNLRALFLVGEISNFKAHSSGHMYMTLKDESASIKAVMFRGNASRLKFRPENGMRIIALGNVSVYERDGQYQFYITDMQPDGLGSLNLAFEQLREKLQKEGLFAAEHKKSLPEYPDTIGVVTSPTGAAFQDIRNVLSRRWPMAKVVISPTQVQGAEAAPQIVSALRELDDSGCADVIILARGGGSIEDLWCFNDERVARTIFDMKTPVITGVGHEVDFTISDFVADYRAPTPSAAAEVAVPDMISEKEKLTGLNLQMQRQLVGKLNFYKEQLLSLTGRQVMKGPVSLINERRLLLDNYQERMNNIMAIKTETERRRFSVEVGRLEAFSPLKVLARGYSIAEKASGVVKSIKDVAKNDDISIRVMDGYINCSVKETREDK